MILGSVGASVTLERRDIEQGRADLARTHRTFNVQLRQALAEGTPGDLLVPLARVEFQEWTVGYQRGYVVDRLVLVDLRARAKQIAALTGTVQQTEREVELELAGRLAGVLGSLRDDVAAAHSAGVDGVAEYDSRYEALAASGSPLALPAETARRLDEAGALAGVVRAATTARIADIAATAAAAAAAAAQAAQAADDARAAAVAALDAARGAATYQHDRAHVDLAQAAALRVAEAAAAIAAIDSRLATAHAVDEYMAVAGDYAYQARLLENLLAIRQNTYNQLARARTQAARTAGLGVDVGAFVARLNTANAQLDAAADSAAILAAADSIRDITTALSAAYANALAHPPPPPGSVVLNVPYFAQVYSLSCEEAALQMALAYEGINRNQDEILAEIGVDRRPPELDGAGNVVHWGNPYSNFVGDPNGYREGAQYGSRSGYGTYYPTIARAATAFGGRVLAAGEGIKPQALYDAISAHHPSVVWVAWQYSPHPVTTYVAFDGTPVMYGAPWEHAVTLVGVSPASVLINNPHGGQEWISRAVFERAYEMFNQMAVTLT